MKRSHILIALAVLAIPIGFAGYYYFFTVCCAPPPAPGAAAPPQETAPKPTSAPTP